MSEAVNVSIAGVTGVIFGIFVLYITVRITSWITDQIEKRKETK